MLRFLRASVAWTFLLLLSAFLAISQSPENATAPLKAVRAEGQKLLTEPQLVALAGLEPGAPIGRKDLQAAADRLVQTGLFSKVNYSFQTRADGLALTFNVEEGLRIPAYFDNVPWFADTEIADAIRKKLPFYDGALPEAGTVVDQAADAINALLTSRGMPASVEHEVIANPLGNGNVQAFRVQGAAMQIAKLEFSDPALASSKIIQQHLPEILGKAYSRMTIDLFLSEQVKPLYLQRGYLRVKLGPPEGRLTGNPNEKLSDQIPVFVPVTPGPVYHWKDVQWSGNTLLSNLTINDLLKAKPGNIADGMGIEAGWDRVREEYARHGYLEVKLDPVAAFDEQAHTVAYTVNVHEGQPYKFGKMILTGLSPVAERRVRTAWPIAPGEIFDKIKFEELLTNLQTHPQRVFGELPVHFDQVGHWLQTDATNLTVDILLDFK